MVELPATPIRAKNMRDRKKYGAASSRRGRQGTRALLASCSKAIYTKRQSAFPQKNRPTLPLRRFHNRRLLSWGRPNVLFALGWAIAG